MKTRELTFNAIRTSAITCICFCVTAIALSAQNVVTLADFQDGGPQGPSTLIQGFDGNFYGTTYEGVSSGQCMGNYCGTFFEMTPDGTVTTLHDFCTQSGCPDGDFPVAILQATDGNFYGITREGASGGVIFRMTPNGQFTTLYSFCSQANCPDGLAPTGLIQAGDGAFYGTTYAGGANGLGTIFKFTPNGVLKTLHSFKPEEGANPSGLVQDSDGNFYGTAFQGGDLNCGFSIYFPGCGTVFTMNPRGEVQPIYAFCRSSNLCEDGALPNPIVLGTDGNLYGTTEFGGHNANSFCDYLGCGTAFKITRDGQFTGLYQFCADFYTCKDGFYPGTLLRGSDGTFYGTVPYGGFFNDICYDGCGTLFAMNRAGLFGAFFRFDETDGSGPSALLQSTDGTFYGMTTQGGTLSGGVIFQASTGLAPFVKPYPQAGKVGKRVIITGTDLSGTSSVSFNGTAAEFTIESKTMIVTYVPSGAVSGFISVSSSSGSLNSNLPFGVIR